MRAYVCGVVRSFDGQRGLIVRQDGGADISFNVSDVMGDGASAPLQGYTVTFDECGGAAVSICNWHDDTSRAAFALWVAAAPMVH